MQVNGFSKYPLKAINFIHVVATLYKQVILKNTKSHRVNGWIHRIMRKWFQHETAVSVVMCISE